MVKKTTADEAPVPTPDSTLIKSFKAARNCSTPLIAIETTDPTATITSIRKRLPENVPVLSWDAAGGLMGLNDTGRAAVGALKMNIAMSVNAAETLLAAERLPELSVLFMHNFHRQMNDTPTLQALWNLRDKFKKKQRMVVALGPGFTLPAEISGDVIVLEEPLPTRDELVGTVNQQHKNAGTSPPSAEVMAQALDAVVGLPTFTAEQVTAMSFDRVDGVPTLIVPKLWQRKIKAIQNTQGLSVYQPRPDDTTLDELKGIDNVVRFMRKFIKAEAFNVLVFIDEMDKSLAGGMSEHTGDSGVSKDQVQQILTYVNDTKSPGVLLAGVAGTGKTQLVKAMGAESGKPVISLDLGGLKGGTVGQSEAQIRAALKVITATAEGRVLFVGTANKTTIFTPEMNRRFPDQFFYDLPDANARQAIWEVYIQKNRLTKSQAEVPPGFDKGWTGAEIQRACERAAMFAEPVYDVAQYIIPQSVSAAPTIAQMRREASGRFLSASHAGFYVEPKVEVDDDDNDGTRQIAWNN